MPSERAMRVRRQRVFDFFGNLSPRVWQRFQTLSVATDRNRGGSFVQNLAGIGPRSPECRELTACHFILRILCIRYDIKCSFPQQKSIPDSISKLRLVIRIEGAHFLEEGIR